MIDCLKCYRLHRNGGVIYCPFLDVQPCIMGEHQIGECPVEEEKKKRQGSFPTAKKLPPSFYECPPPEFIPAQAQTPLSIDWEPVHEKIFELIREGYNVSRIADVLGVKPGTLSSYLKRYFPDEHEG